MYLEQDEKVILMNTFKNLEINSQQGQNERHSIYRLDQTKAIGANQINDNLTNNQTAMFLLNFDLENNFHIIPNF